MKFNNLMNQKKYTISAGGLAVGGGVQAAVWAVSIDDGDEEGEAGSASFLAQGEREE